jgi:transposase
MARPRVYSDELRRRAMEEVLERGRPVPQVARDLGIKSSETLRRWIRQAERDRGLKPGPTSDELTEIRKLRKEVADQQRTIEILKAATTFFAKEADPRPR